MVGRTARHRLAISAVAHVSIPAFTRKIAEFRASLAAAIRIAGFRVRRAKRVVSRLTSAVTAATLNSGLKEGGQMIRQASAWVLALLLGVATAFAQQGTTEVRGRVLDPQGAMLPGVTVTVQEPGHRHVPRDRLQRRTAPSSSAASCRDDTRSAPSCRASRSSCARTWSSRSARPTSIDVPLEVGARQRRRERLGRIAAGRRDLEGGRRQHHHARARRAAERSTATSSASSACCPASSRRSAPSRSAATRSR